MTRLLQIISHATLLAVLLATPASARGEDAPERSYTISPNERIHVIQRKVDLLAGRFEVTAYPATAQINSRWTEHVGLALAGTYHATDTFGLQLLAGMNLYLARETDLQSELREKALLQPPSAPSILTRFFSVLAMELSPIYGKIAFYKAEMMSYALVLTAGAGIVETAVQLLPKVPVEEGGRGRQVVAAAGLQGAGLLGAGFRVSVTDHWVLRLEVRDLIYSARITKLNGCTKDELRQLSGVPSGLSNSCKPGKFDQQFLATDARLAEGRADGSSESVNQVSAYLGVSYLF